MAGSKKTTKNTGSIFQKKTVSVFNNNLAPETNSPPLEGN